MKYKFRVRAHNIHGWGMYSDEFDLYAATKPAKPDIPTTDISNIFVVISWDKPYENSGTINGYRI